MEHCLGHDQFFAFHKEILCYIHTLDTIQWPDPQFRSRLSELVSYTTSGGKCMRGLLSVHGFLELTKIDPNSEDAKPCYALGWAQEILQASFLVADDFMDRTPLRRGKPCWYIKDDNSYASVSDSYFLENLVYCIIDHYMPNYPIETIREIKNLFHFTTMKTAFGQFIDMTLKEPTLENWTLTVVNKTSYYSIWMPFVAGLCLSQKVPKTVWNSDELRDSLILAGKLFQCQDDWIDIYGTSEKIGKTGTDIEEGKCTWLFAKAMEVANEQQRELLKENHGHKEKEKVEIVKKIYSDLNIEQLCLNHQNEEYEKLKDLCGKMDPQIPRGLINYLLAILDHRQY